MVVARPTNKLTGHSGFSAHAMPNLRRSFRSRAPHSSPLSLRRSRRSPSCSPSASRGGRPALTGSAAAIVALALIVVALGPLLSAVPLHALQFVVGVLLLMFGLRWLRKAILRAVEIIALHDEEAAFARETRALSEAARRDGYGLDWIAGATAFKAVLLEGIEVVFIVIAIGAGRGLLGLASGARLRPVSRSRP